MDDEQLRLACESLLENVVSLPGNQAWISEVLHWMQRVRDVGHDEFVSEKFQLELWNTQAVSATGMGHVDISKVAADAEVAEQLWQLKVSYANTPAPLGREVLINNAWSKVSSLVAQLSKRRPRLKMYRLFALLCPGSFTTIADFRKLLDLASQMGVNHSGEVRPAMHRLVLERLEEVLGAAPDALSHEGVTRLTLPWFLYASYVQNQEQEATEISEPDSRDERLNPLPPERRRRGMLAIGGGLATIQAMIEFLAHGSTRDDFIEHLHSMSPQSKRSTLNTQLNALIAEWGVIRADQASLHLTSRGEALLESGDPNEVIDWMITRILGFDYLLKALSFERLSRRDALLKLREANPNWKSDFAPASLFNWLRALHLIEIADKWVRLTALGEQWVQRIDWTPEPLQVEEDIDSLIALLPNLAWSEDVERPALAEIIQAFDSSLPFSPSLIGQLDAGLWSHPRRHFAVLTGLSGAGKTQLARGYALSLWQTEQQPSDGLLIVPVQPGWHDYSSLLGYVNPLESESYVRTRVLDFVLQAASDPTRPYTLVLDEMNLSHPEQYLAPFLSAMETGECIDLHGQAEAINGVPATIAYPSNLVIIGTVNMDETTHGLSDKVLDRASVIEFWDIDVHAYPGWDKADLATEQLATLRELMERLMTVLRPARLHFGWRTLHDIIGYLQQTQHGGIIEFQEALDQAIYSKILPKLRGEDSPRLQKVFKELGDTLERYKLERSAVKVSDMLQDLLHSGSTRFWR
ncbi:McrB family protein [Pseudomonas sp. COR18]|uniref:McrB family protein n=1 Tax=Pseudomonas sp. COR18 TaxID=3399680 RepID=UPI003AFFC5C9